MKIRIHSFAVLSVTLLSLLGATLAHATGYAFQSENKVTLQDSTNKVIPYIETVALGAFSTGFTPSESNTSFWSGYWLTGENSEGGVDGHEWAAGFTLNEGSAIGAGTRLYLWVTYSNAETSQLETLLLTDPEWVTVVSSSMDQNYHYYDFGAGTTAIVGLLDVTEGIARLSSATVVPEPAVFAALLGAGTLGFTFLWRRRTVPNSK